MSRLLLRFHNIDFSALHWALDDDIGSVELNWQFAQESQYSDLFSKHPIPVVIILPQESIFITEFELPEKASRQVLASIEYQIEDQLAQDTEMQHFAVGEQTDNKVPVVVVEQSIMMACQSLQEKYNLRIGHIIPEIHLCPQADTPGSVNIIESQNGLLLRYGFLQGFKCQQELLKSMLTMINREYVINQVNYYLDSKDDYDELLVDKYDSQFHLTSELGGLLDDAPIVNLQQRQFRASSNWSRLFQAWQSVAAVLVLLLTAAVFSRVLALQTMESKLDAIKASQYELVKDYLDVNIRHTDNLKKALIKRLQEQSNGQKQQDFLALLVEFSQAHSKYSSINIIKLGYQQSRLSIDISSAQLNDVEALHAALNARGLTTQLERLNIKPEQVLGQFIIEAGKNG